MKFIIYKDKSKQFRWKLVAKNGKIIADSGEGYTRKRSAIKGIRLVETSIAADIIDQTLVK